MTNKERYEKAKPAYIALMKCYPSGLEDLPGEEWLPVPDYPAYHVSNFGRIKSFWNKTPRIMKPALGKDGYLRVDLYKDGKSKHFRVNRLIAICFIPNPSLKPQVNHIDGHPFNNHVSNLEWVTSSENKQHAYGTGLQKPRQGEGHHGAKLTAEQVQFIRSNPDDLTVCKLADFFGIQTSTISLIQMGKLWKSAGGSVRKPITPRVPDDIRQQIRVDYQKGVRGCGARVLAKKYGVATTTISNIIREG